MTLAQFQDNLETFEDLNNKTDRVGKMLEQFKPVPQEEPLDTLANSLGIDNKTNTGSTFFERVIGNNISDKIDKLAVIPLN